MISDDHNNSGPQQGGGDAVTCRLAINCAKDVIARGESVEIHLSLLGRCASFIGAPVFIEMANTAGATVLLQQSAFVSLGETLVISVQPSIHLPTGMYQISGSLDGTSYWTVVSLLLVDSDFEAMIDSGQSALEVYSDAVSKLLAGESNQVPQALFHSAQLFASIHCYEAAITAWRDAATLYLAHEQRSSAQQSLKEAMACVFELAQSRRRERSASREPSDAPPEILPLRCWDIHDLVELAVSIRGPQNFLIPGGLGVGKDLLSRTELRGFLAIAAEFAINTESYRLFITNLISFPDFAEACYRGLLAFGPTSAMEYLGTITSMARQYPDEVSYSALIYDLASPDPRIIGDALNEASSFDPKDQRLFVDTICDELTLTFLFNGPRCSIWYHGKERVAEVVGRYDIFKLLLPRVSTERYEVVQSLVKGVGA
jgi:hypothetical protein